MKKLKIFLLLLVFLIIILLFFLLNISSSPIKDENSNDSYTAALKENIKVKVKVNLENQDCLKDIFLYNNYYYIHSKHKLICYDNNFNKILWENLDSVYYYYKNIVFCNDCIYISKKNNVKILNYKTGKIIKTIDLRNVMNIYQNNDLIYCFSNNDKIWNLSIINKKNEVINKFKIDLKFSEIDEAVISNNNLILIDLFGEMIIYDISNSFKKIKHLNLCQNILKEFARVIKQKKCTLLNNENKLLIPLTNKEENLSFICIFDLINFDIDYLKLKGEILSNIIKNEDMLYFNLNENLVAYDYKKQKILKNIVIGFEYQKLLLKDENIYMGSFSGNLLAVSKTLKKSSLNSIIKNNYELMSIEGDRKIHFNFPEIIINNNEIIFTTIHKVYSIKF